MTTKIYKAKSVRIAIQSDQYTIPANPKWFYLPSASCSVKATEGSEKLDVIRGGAEPNETFLNGIDDISGSISFNLRYSHLPFLFGASIGATTPTDAAVGNWTTATAYAIGDVINGTTPSTDDLVAFDTSLTGLSGATAPSTGSLADRENIIDNEIEWAVRKGSLKTHAGNLQSCLNFFIIEVEVEAACAAETVWYRKIGCAVQSLALTFDKNTGGLTADISILGSTAETNIKKDGTLDATYEDLGTISGNVELVIDDMIVKKGDLDFTIDGVGSDYVETFSITIDNTLEAKNKLSKSGGKNTKMIYGSGSKNISGSIGAMFSTEMQGAMDGVSTREFKITADSGYGDKFSLTIPSVKYSKDEPDINTGALMINPNWNAEPVTGASALQYSVTALGLYK